MLHKTNRAVQRSMRHAAAPLLPLGLVPVGRFQCIPIICGLSQDQAAIRDGVKLSSEENKMYTYASGLRTV